MQMNKKNILLFLTVVLINFANATVQLLPNTSFESYGDDGYGRIMPADWDLWTEDWNWLNIPNVEVKTFSVDGIAPNNGDASFQMNTIDSTADVALIHPMGQIGADIGLGWYHIGGFIKGDMAAADVGIDIFGPDWSFWWGGGTTLITSEDWTYFGFDFEVTDPEANYNIRMKSTAGSSFLIDDIQLVTEVPEPTTMLLLIVGGLCLGKRRISL
jgi:hypothetical protein